MLGPSRRSIAFWLVVLLFGLGAGWAVQQGWRWPSLALFDRASEPEREATPEVVAEQPVTEEPATEEPSVAGPVPEAASPPPPPGDNALPAATDSAPPAERARVEEEADPAKETTPLPMLGATAADPTSEPPEAEVATTEPAETGAPQAGSEAATGEHAGEAPEQDQGPPDLAAVGAAEGEAPGAGAASGVPPSRIPTEPETEAGAEPAAEPAAGPSFDIVRVGRDGRAVIAGRAAPGAEVEVRAGGQVIDRVRATRRGEWVAIPGLPLAAGDQELTAVATRDGAAPVESDQVVVVAVPDPATPAPAPAAVASASAEPVAVLLPRDGGGSGRILQAPGRLSAEGTLALMTVSYDEGGKVLLSGEAPPGVPVRIYVDNRPAATVVGDAKGAWAAGLDEALAPGTYTLRVDQLDAGGQTVARIETPFTRVSEPPVEGNLQVDYVVVQPGNSLWRIARRLSGKGLDYVHIYGANDAQIRNPDLIYPGQVFEIPREFGSAG